MSGWRLALSLDTLRRQFNTAYPDRDRSSDGTIGDAAHASTWSDHNPNAEGVVCALDIDTDLDGTDDSNDPTMEAIVENVRLNPHPDLKYVIFQSRIFSSYARSPYGPFEWRPYSGDPHTSHVHVSVGQGPDGRSAPGTYDDTTPWAIDLGGPAPTPPPEDDMISHKAHFGTQAWLPPEQKGVYLIQPYYASKRHLNGPEHAAYAWLDAVMGNRLLEDQTIHEYDENFFNRIPVVGEA